MSERRPKPRHYKHRKDEHPDRDWRREGDDTVDKNNGKFNWRQELERLEREEFDKER